MKNRIAFVIPYFGKLPDYFHLWLVSAKYNKDYDFFLFSDVNELPRGRAIAVSY